MNFFPNTYNSGSTEQIFMGTYIIDYIILIWGEGFQVVLHCLVRELWEKALSTIEYNSIYTIILLV